MHGVERGYSVVAFVVPRTAEQPWNAGVWQHAEPLLAGLISQCRGPVGLRGNQQKRNGAFYKLRGFGALAWNTKSFQKWTSPDGQSLDASSGREQYFSNLEVWSPRWQDCFEGKGPPDFFLSVTNPNGGALPNDATRPYQTVVILALADDVIAGIAGFDQTILDLALVFSCSFWLTRQAPWGRASGTGFTDAIQDFSGPVGRFSLRADASENSIQADSKGIWSFCKAEP